MLAITKYPTDYIASVRSGIDARMASYRKLSEVPPSLYNDLVLVLELAFVHRLRKDEGKDGNPVNEVRLLALALLTNEGRMLDGKSLKLNPKTSILGYAEGDAIVLTESDFTRLAEAFFPALTARFAADPM
jgi:hypothetical protein